MPLLPYAPSALLIHSFVTVACQAVVVAEQK